MLCAALGCTVETASPAQFQGDGFDVPEGGKVSLAADVVRVPSCEDGQLVGRVASTWTCVTPGSVSPDVVTLSGCREGQLIARSSSGWRCVDAPSTGGVGTVNAGDGLAGGGTGATVGLEVSFGGNGTAKTAARSDHGHAFASLSGIPAGLSDGDDDALAELGISCAEDGHVARWNGSAFECARPAFGDLGGVPAGLADGDDDALAELGATCAAAGGVPRWSGSVFECRPPSFADLTSVPPSLADGDDDTVGALQGCDDGSVLEYAGGRWGCTGLMVDPIDDLGSVRGSDAPHLEDLQGIIDDLRRRVRRLEGPPGYVKIPPGKFLLGSPLDEPGRRPDEVPTVEVEITTAFWMKQTEVTQAEWCEVLNHGLSTPVCDPLGAPGSANPSGHRNCSDCPVESVRWFDVIPWLNRLSELEGLVPCYSGGPFVWSYAGRSCEGYRLPSEAEWEWAAHARTGTASFYSGQISVDGDTCAPLDPKLDPIAWYCGNSRSSDPAGDPNYDKTQYGGSAANTQPVGGRLPNAFGLFDMLGNVSEWTNTRRGVGTGDGAALLSAARDYGPLDGLQSKPCRDYPCKDPDRPASGRTTGSDPEYIVVKGGSFHAFARDARIAVRLGPTPNPGHLALARGISPGVGFISMGFRPVRTAR